MFFVANLAESKPFGSELGKTAHLTGSGPGSKGGSTISFCINLAAVLDIRVTQAGPDATLGRVRNLILAAEKTKLPLARSHKPTACFLP